MLTGVYIFLTRTLFALSDLFGRICAGIADRLPFWLRPSFYFFLLTYPVRRALSMRHVRSWRNLLFGLPAVAAFLFAGWLHYWEWMDDLTIADRYLKQAHLAITRHDFPQAAVLLERVMREDVGQKEEAQFALAELFQDSGVPERAESLYQSLAPDVGSGYPRAHRRLAIMLCESLSGESTEFDTRKALHHLDASLDETSPEVILARGRHAIAIGDLSAARGYLEQVSSDFPEVWATLGTIYLESGQHAEALSSYTMAREFLRDELADDPAARPVREDYAAVLIHMGEFDEARITLEEGLQLDPEGNWNRLLAGYYLTIHDILSQEAGHSVIDLFAPLAKSLDHEPNFFPALQRLMSHMNLVGGDNAALKATLSRIVAEAEQPALAHLCLGNVSWVEHNTEQAHFHFERAVAIDPKLTVVLNNLAWLLAHDEKQRDLDRALAMINEALAENPGFPRFLDTRGTILMKMDRWNDALADLETAVREMPNASPVHVKLAEIYDRLGFPVIAESHRELAGKQPEPGE